tara:strand:+ start:59 stop:436 length:378 start_codon:yes stop_codon:yes gene_type:complete
MEDRLQGIWRLVESRAWDLNGNLMPEPYGKNPMGQIFFSNTRMLAALCNGDTVVGGRREYISYGGVYKFDGVSLDVLVDIASDDYRIGGHEIRQVELLGEKLLLRPPPRKYGGLSQQRELLWERL